jgi:hypothetical protein
MRITTRIECPICEGKGYYFETIIDWDSGHYQGDSPCYECNMTGKVENDYYLQRKLGEMEQRGIENFWEIIEFEKIVCSIDSCDLPF